MKKKLQIILLFISFISFGQKDSVFKCGTNYSSLSKEQKIIIDQIEKAYLSRKLSNTLVDTTTLYTVPIVFHVFHLGEPVGSGSNVSEEYIQNMVKALNDGFRAKDKYFEKTKDSKIQFVLAGIDPNGNPTNGIDRIDGRVVNGYITNGVRYPNELLDHLQFRNLAQWDTNNYFNIYHFWGIFGVGAFADIGQPNLYMQLGNASQKDFDSWNSTYIHEMGHALGLWHTFEGDHDGTSCPSNANPLVDGDRISDTEPHIRYFAKEFNAINNCTGIEIGHDTYNNFMNYGNYAYSRYLFSKGQIQKIRTYTFDLRSFNVNEPFMDNLPKCQTQTFEIESQRILYNDFAILESKNCENGTVFWFRDSLRIDFLADGKRFITPKLQSNKTYFATCQKDNCISKNTSVKVIISEDLKQLSITPQFIELNSSATLKMKGCKGNVNWYDNEIGGNILGSGPIYITPNLNKSTAYFATCDIDNLPKQKNRIIAHVFIKEQQIVLKNNELVSFCNNQRIMFKPINNRSTGDFSPYSFYLFQNDSLIFESRLFPLRQSATIIDHFVNLTDEDFSESGTYQVYVSNGVTASQKAEINVVKKIFTSILINNVELGYQEICTGSSTTLKSKIHSIMRDHNQFFFPYTIQWYKDNQPIINQTKDSLIVNSPGNYKAEFSYPGCKIQSSVSIYQSSFIFVPYVVDYDYSKTMTLFGDSVIRINSSYSTPTSSYKWYRNDTEIINMNTPSITVRTDGNYKVKVTDSNCNIITTSKSKYVDTSFKNKFEIASNNVILCNESSGYMYINNYKGLSSNLTIKWFKNNQLMKSGKLADGTNREFFADTEGSYYAICTDGKKTLKSNILKFTANRNLIVPNITYDYLGCNTFKLKSNVSGKWFKDGINIGGGTSLVVNNPAQYVIQNDNGFGCSEYDTIQYSSLIKNGIKITLQDNKSNICGQNDQVFLSIPNSNSNVTYQWQKDGVDIGYANWYTYTANAPGTYKCKLNFGGCIEATDEITVGNSPNLQLVEDNSNVWCSDNFIKIRLIGQNSNINNTIKWYKDGKIIPGSSSVNLFVKETGNYKAEVNEFGCVAESNQLFVNYNNTPIFNLIPSNTLNLGERAILEVQGCEGVIRWYESNNDFLPIFSGNNFQTPNLFSNTSYYVSCEANNCNSNKLEAKIKVCNSHLNFTTNIDSGIYKASDSIEARVNVPSNTIFQAAKKIILTPGFQAGSSEVFEAKIGGCN